MDRPGSDGTLVDWGVWVMWWAAMHSIQLVILGALIVGFIAAVVMSLERVPVPEAERRGVMSLPQPLYFVVCGAWWFAGVLASALVVALAALVVGAGLVFIIA
jgi:hypothetical protein